MYTCLAVFVGDKSGTRPSGTADFQEDQATEGYQLICFVTWVTCTLCYKEKRSYLYFVAHTLVNSLLIVHPDVITSTKYDMFNPVFVCFSSVCQKVDDSWSAVCD